MSLISVLQASIPLVPGPRGMPGPFPKPAAGPSPARAGEIPRTAELEPVTSRLSAQPAEAAVKESLNSPRSKPQSSQDGNLSRLDPESSSAAAVQLQNKGKGSSFDKIMLRLGADFPNFTRYVYFILRSDSKINSKTIWCTFPLLPTF